MIYLTWLTFKSNNQPQNSITIKLNDILKSVTFNECNTRLRFLDNATLLDHIMTSVSEDGGAKTVRNKDELHKVVNIIAKQWHTYCSQMSTGQILALLYLAVGEIPKLTVYLTKACFKIIDLHDDGSQRRSS